MTRAGGRAHTGGTAESPTTVDSWCSLLLGLSEEPYAHGTKAGSISALAPGPH